MNGPAAGWSPWEKQNKQLPHYSSTHWSTLIYCVSWTATNFYRPKFTCCSMCRLQIFYFDQPLMISHRASLYKSQSPVHTHILTVVLYIKCFSITPFTHDAAVRENLGFSVWTLADWRSRGLNQWPFTSWATDISSFLLLYTQILYDKEKHQLQVVTHYRAEQ